VPALGVTVNVYVVPEPERLDAVPPVTLISPSVSPVTDSENVAVTVNAAFVGFGAEVLSVTVGAVLSKVTKEPSVVLLTVVPAFDARSENDIENGTVPAVSPDAMTYVAVHEVPEPDTVAACVAMVTVGVLIVSEDVKVSVTVSPTLALLVTALLDWMWTGDNVGAVLSITSGLVPVTLLVAGSCPVILTVAVPSEPLGTV
jgi:hypothetical protein